MKWHTDPYYQGCEIELTPLGKKSLNKKIHNRRAFHVSTSACGKFCRVLLEGNQAPSSYTVRFWRPKEEEFIR